MIKFQNEKTKSILQLLKKSNLRVFAVDLVVNVFENQIIIGVQNDSTFEFCLHVNDAEQFFIFFPINRLSVTENRDVIKNFVEKEKQTEYFEIHEYFEILRKFLKFCEISTKISAENFRFQKISIFRNISRQRRNF